MASAFTHAIAGLAIGTAFHRKNDPARFWGLGAVLAALPDVDGVGFWLGVPYQSVFGHRGFTHSFVFAAIAAAVGLLAFRGRAIDGDRMRIWSYLFLATASHGILDAMTSGGGGVAFFAPIMNERFFLPWRPILVSPMNPRRFFSARWAAILGSELVWVWIPAAMFVAATYLLRRRSVTDPLRDSGRVSDRR